MALNTDEIDTEIELGAYKITVRLKIVQLFFRYITLMTGLVMAGLLGGLGLIAPEYAVFIIIMVLTYEVGSNGSMIKDLFEKITGKMK